jgi:hypothetical protein
MERQRSSGSRLVVILGLAGWLGGCSQEDGCRFEAQTFCFQGVLYSQDSCGRLGEALQPCPHGCRADGLACDPCARATCESLGKGCGSWDDGCGGTLACGGCPALEHCAPQGQCACDFEACGATCCPLGQACTPLGCCRTLCGGRVCGPDGCGGECGVCGPGETCRPDGQCACAFTACGEACCEADEGCHQAACCRPDCQSRACGPDGCGGSCGACGLGQTCKADGQCGPGGWQGVRILGARAPDEYSLWLDLEGDPGELVASNPLAYTITSERGALHVANARLVPGPRVELTTGRQKLGVGYRVAVSGLAADFTSADTARFWIWDWDTHGQKQVRAQRVGVGASCVLYVEEGWTASDVAETIQAFDEQVYPTLTSRWVAAPDLDGNGRILLLGLDGRDDYGGYFSVVNAYPDSLTSQYWGLRSNEMEMLHLNMRMGGFEVRNVVTHEFAHLLYHERHGFTDPYWEYHDEGLAESAVHLAWGVNQQAIDFFLWDPQGVIGRGMSVIHWEYARYENYAAAYLLWAYLAGRLGGLEGFRELFDLPTGGPEELDAFLRDRLGLGLGEARFEQLLATWVQAPAGPYSYSGMLSFPAARAPRAPSGTASLDLDALGGAYFRLGLDEVDYPGTQGPSIRYAGVDGSGAVDLEPPFRVEGGVLVVAHTGIDWPGWPTEHAGPDLPATLEAAPRALCQAPIPPSWRSPPPIRPDRLEELVRWREAVRAADW